MKTGVLGTGGIVKSITPTLKQMEDAECYAIASRTAERAKQTMGTGLSSGKGVVFFII